MALTGAVIVPVAAGIAVGVLVSLGLNWLERSLSGGY